MTLFIANLYSQIKIEHSNFWACHKTTLNKSAKILHKIHFEYRKAYRKASLGKKNNNKVIFTPWH